MEHSIVLARIGLPFVSHIQCVPCEPLCFKAPLYSRVLIFFLCRSPLSHCVRIEEGGVLAALERGGPRGKGRKSEPPRSAGQAGLQ